MPALCGGCYYLCFQIMKMKQGIGDASDRLFVPLPQVTCWNLITKKLMLGKLEPLGKHYERTLLSQVGQMSLNKRPGRAYFLPVRILCLMMWALGVKEIVLQLRACTACRELGFHSQDPHLVVIPPTHLAPGDPTPFWSVRAFVLTCI